MHKIFLKEEFLQKLKTDSEFNSRYGRNHITEGKMVLPPCHYGFQVYTRELNEQERWELYVTTCNRLQTPSIKGSTNKKQMDEYYKEYNIPTRAISLMWNQRSVDTPLGLPFNIASYGLLLEIIAKIVNMVPDELIGNLGDTHIYSNQIDGVKEQIGRELSLEERLLLADKINKEIRQDLYTYSFNNPIYTGGIDQRPDDVERHDLLSDLNIPKRTRGPFPLPQLRINTEFWLTKTGECGVGELSDNIDALIKGMEIEDFQIENYKSHPAIKMPLSN
jgi:thymidylate synthase